MNPLLSLSQSIISALSADVTLNAMVNGVYGDLPNDVKFPCIAVENTVARDVSTRTTNGFHVAINVRAFSRERSNQQVSDIINEVRRILDNASLSPTGCTVTGIKEARDTIFRLQDGKTWSGSIEFVIMLQEGDTFVANGADFIIKIGDGASPVESFTTIGGLRGAGISLGNKLIDYSNLSTGKWRKLVENAGISAMSISGSGFFTDSNAENILQSAALSGSLNSYQILLGNNDTISGKFLVSQYKRLGWVGEEEFSVVLESGGEVEVV